MALFGDGFDPLQPASSDPVKFGADWLRDIKRRLKDFVSVMHDPETGLFKDSVIDSASLKDVVAAGGTFSRVKVNTKGQVIFGDTAAEQQVAKVYRAAFLFDPNPPHTSSAAFIEKEASNGVSTISTSGGYGGLQNSLTSAFAPENYAHQGGVRFALYQWTPPAGVRRIKATIVGGGGGAATGTPWFGGGGGELVEVNIPLTGKGDQPLDIMVGDGGQSAASSSPSSIEDGTPSGIRLSASVYAHAGGGRAAQAAAGGLPGSAGPTNSTSLLILRGAGSAGAQGVAGASGSSAFSVGAGAGVNPSTSGIVVLEWFA